MTQRATVSLGLINSLCPRLRWLNVLNRFAVWPWMGAFICVLASPIDSDGLLAQSRSGRGDPVMPITSARDGVRLLSHSRAALQAAPVWEVAPRPIATFGGPDAASSYDLTNAFELALLSGDRFAALPIGRGVLIFGSDGRGLYAFGKRGQGPGDFLDGRMFGLPGDTLVVIDRGNARITWLVPGKGVVGTESTVGRLGTSVHRPVGQLPSGAIVVASAVPVRPGKPNEREIRKTVALLLLSRGDSGRVIAEVPDLQLRMIEVTSGGKKAKVQDLLRFGLQARVAVWDTLIATGDGARYAIDLRNRSGRTIATLQVDSPRRPVSKAMRDAAIRDEIARLGPRGVTTPVPAEQQRIVRSAPYADSLPAFGELFVSNDGLLWALDTRVPGDQGWAATAFRRDGAIVARIRGQGDATPVAFAANRVLLRRVDADDVVSFTLHQVGPRR